MEYSKDIPYDTLVMHFFGNISQCADALSPSGLKKTFTPYDCFLQNQTSAWLKRISRPIAAPLQGVCWHPGWDRPVNGHYSCCFIFSTKELTSSPFGAAAMGFTFTNSSQAWMPPTKSFISCMSTTPLLNLAISKAVSAAMA